MFKNSIFTIPVAIIFLFVNLCGFMLGLFDTFSGPNDSYAGCKYQSIADYIPLRIVTCELLRRRWK